MRFKFPEVRDDDGELLHEEFLAYKIGITDRRVKERFSEVLMSMYDQFRFVPEATIKRYSTVNGYRKMEKVMHKFYEKNNYHRILMNQSQTHRQDTDNKQNIYIGSYKSHGAKWNRVSGYTEFFINIDEDELLENYDILKKKLQKIEPTDTQAYINGGDNKPKGVLGSIGVRKEFVDMQVVK